MKKLWSYLGLFTMIGCLCLTPNFVYGADTIPSSGIIIEDDTLTFNSSNKKGRIWVAPGAKPGTSIPLILALHGKGSGYMIGSGATFPLDNYTLKHIQSGAVEPLIIAAPNDKNDSVSTIFKDIVPNANFTNFINEINTLLEPYEITVNRQKIIVVGHSNGASAYKEAGAHGIASNNPGLFALVNLDGAFFDPVPNLVREASPKITVAIAGQNREKPPGIGDRWSKLILGTNPEKLASCDSVFLNCETNSSKTAYYFKTKQLVHGPTVKYFGENVLPILFGAGGTNSGNNQNTNTQSISDQIANLLRTPEPLIKIPGLEFTGTEELRQAIVEDSGSAYLQVPFLGEYFSAIYQLVIATAVVISMIMIVIGGIYWTTAGGNTETMAKAKGFIGKALIGLLLSLGSYLILFSINPNLVKFQNLRIFVIKRSELHETLESSHDDAGSAGQVSSGELYGSIPKKGDPAVDCPLTNARENYACRAECVKNLPEEKKTKVAKPEYKTELTGILDCGHVKKIRDVSTINTIGIHEGSPGPAVNSWWAKQQRGYIALGTHYFVTRAGKIIQLADERFVMRHGIYNDTSIGIDLQPMPGSVGRKKTVKWYEITYPDAQYAALNRLLNDIKSRYGNLRILGHCQVGGSNHGDPRNFDWRKIGESNEAHKTLRCLGHRPPNSEESSNSSEDSDN